MDNFDYIAYIKDNKLLAEIKVNDPNHKIPEGWEDITDSYKGEVEHDEEGNDGEVVGAYSAPMEGWDENHEDTVKIIKYENGKFKVEIYISFGEYPDFPLFNSYDRALRKAIEEMEAIKEDWVDEDDFEGDNEIDEVKINNPVEVFKQIQKDKDLDEIKVNNPSPLETLKRNLIEIIKKEQEGVKMYDELIDHINDTIEELKTDSDEDEIRQTLYSYELGDNKRVQKLIDKAKGKQNENHSPIHLTPPKPDSGTDDEYGDEEEEPNKIKEQIKNIVRKTLDEMSMSGGGTAGSGFTPGVGEQYATKFAFKRKKNVKK